MEACAKTCAVLAALLPWAAGCGEPCVDCPDIAGNYLFTSDAAAADQSTCKRLFAQGWSAHADVEQNGSEVRIPALSESCTLYEDLRLRCRPRSEIVVPEGGDESQSMSATVLLQGTVAIEGARVTFRGKRTVSAMNGNCALDVPLRWEPF